MECQHSSIREYTKARGKGNAPNLSEVSAKAVCKYVAQHHFSYTGTGNNTCDQEQQTQQTSQKRLGGGGPWKAFLKERAVGRKLSKSIIQELAQEYKELNQAEFEYFSAQGRIMVFQNRFNRLQGIEQSERLQLQPEEEQFQLTAAAHFESSGKDILETVQPCTVMDGDDFSEKYLAFSKIVNLERAKQRKEKRLETEQLKDPTTDGSCDSAFQELSRPGHGGPGLLDGIRQAPSSVILDHFEWKLPVTRFTQTCLHEVSRIEGQLRLADLEDKWLEDHRLVQHEEQEPLQISPEKQFTLSHCAKLGVCVCQRGGKSAVAMTHKLVAHTKQCHPGTHKQPSAEREAYVEGLVVVELASEELGPNTLYSQGAKVIYLHAGHTNFMTWESTCTRLHVSLFNPFTGPLTHFRNCFIIHSGKLTPWKINLTRRCISYRTWGYSDIPYIDFILYIILNLHSRL